MLQLVKEQTLDYDSFVSTMKRIVKERMGYGYDVRIYKVIKNNSLELDSLVVLKEGKNFAPNIYLMPYYESYLEGNSIRDIGERLCSIYRHCSVPIVEENFTYSFPEMRSYVFFRLVSFERNKKLLDKIPHIKYLDLAITFHCLVRNDDEGIGTIRISNEHLKQWDISLSELEKLAVENTKKLFPASIKSMEEVLKGVYDDLMTEGDNSFTEDIINQFPSVNKSTKHQKMYILTNQKGINGASCMLYEDVIRDFANHLATDLYILPSSIHEIILVPKEKNMKKETLCKMVEDVNRTQVAREEVLSDRVYLFSRKDNTIVM